MTYEVLNDISNKQYWQAYFIQIGFHLNKHSCTEDELFYLTTEVFVVPDIYPVQDCFKEECNTYLV